MFKCRNIFYTCWDASWGEYKPTIKNVRCTIHPVKKVLPRAIGIDEFKGDAGGEKYQTIIVDVENREVLDVMPDRRVKTIETYLKQCDIGNVQIDDSMVCGFGGCPGHLRID